MKVSIIIPSYNHAPFLQQRLESIASQTFGDWEAIIIDDKSADNSVEIIRLFIQENSNFKVKHFIVNDQNTGSGYFSWQKGIELAETEYVWIAETDDYSHPAFLEESIKILEENKNSSLVFCSTNYVDKNEKLLYDSINRTKDLKIDKNHFGIFDSKIFTGKTPFNTYIPNGSSVVFRKPKGNIPNEIFMYKQSSDIFLWTYLIQNKSFVFLNKKLNFFRRHKDSTTTKMSILVQKKVYFEKVQYLNFFEQNYKFQIFLDHYVKHYVWSNKKEVFNYKFLRQIKGVNAIDVKYFGSVMKFILIKIKSKWW